MLQLAHSMDHILRLMLRLVNPGVSSLYRSHLHLGIDNVTDHFVDVHPTVSPLSSPHLRLMIRRRVGHRGCVVDAVNVVNRAVCAIPTVSLVSP